MLEQYHQIAVELRKSRGRDQAEAALVAVNNLPEGVQVALCKALAKERNQDAADVLAAINELSPIKNVHKESRRSLIQLEGAHIYPRWQLSAPQPFALQPVDFDGFDEDDEEDDGDEDDEEDDEFVDLVDLNPEEVAITFIESLFEDDFDTAYTLLASSSPLREGLSLDEWVERRVTWADEAEPVDVEPGFAYERPSQPSLLLLPPGVGLSSDSKEIEAVWSVELDDTEMDDTMPELPKATAVNDVTDRHWFWATFTLVQEDDDSWRIQSMVDEGVKAQALTVEELQQRIHEHDAYVEDFRTKHTLEEIEQFSDTESQFYAGEIYRHILLANAYSDILIKKTPLDRDLYENAAGRVIAFNQAERSMVYLEPLVEQFEEGRAESLRRLAVVQQLLC